jgi:hypothetical protein
MGIADRINADGAVFVDPDHFGEQIVYTPWNVTHGTATAALDGSGGVASVAVATPGSGYQEPPPVLLTGGGGKGAAAVATIDPATGRLAAIAVSAAGEGYTSPPAVVVGGCYAVVRREMPGKFGTTPAKTAMLKCTVRNSATDGIVRINSGKDKVTTTRRVGGEAGDFTVAGVISQTKAIWKLRLK